MLKWLLWMFLPYYVDDPDAGGGDDDAGGDDAGADTAGGDDDSGADEGDDDGGEGKDSDAPSDDEPKSAGKGSRANDRIRALRDREAAARRDAEELRAQLQERDRREQEARESARRREEEDDKDLPYDQKLYRYAQRRDREVDSKLAQTEARLADQADRTSFGVKAATDPLYSKYADRVEEELAKMRRQGSNAPREAILTFLVGKDTIAARGSSSKQSAKAKERVKNARGEPVRARSDVSSHRQRVKSLEERLLDVPL